MGLANICVADDVFDAELERLIGDIAANSSFSHAANKRLLTETDGLPLGAGLAHDIIAARAAGRACMSASRRSRSGSDGTRSCRRLMQRSSIFRNASCA